MKKLTLILVLISIFSITQAQKNIVFRDSLHYSDLLNDVWGYADTSGNEYALVGVFTGVSIVNVSNPDSIFEVVWVAGVSSTWRDLKTLGEFAYVTNETSGGLKIIDLSYLPDSVVTTTYTGAGLIKAHNIYIDENGIAYLFGTNVGVGGALFLDLSDPIAPDSIGIYDTFYLHDGYVRGDTLYGAEIYKGWLSIVDISDKSSPSVLGTKTTPDLFTHNVWISDDASVAFTTDEKTGAYVTAYDISTPSSIAEIDKYQSNPGSGVIPHNVHVLNDYLITSYYRDGVTIVDADRPDNLVEVGFYDTHPSSGSGFDGDWGAYPYLPSGNILVTDRSEGLHVLTPTYKRACYLEGIVKNATSMVVLSGVLVTIMPDSVTATTNSSGEYKMGISDSSTIDVTFEKTGYYTKSISNVPMDNGVLQAMDILLIPDTFSTCNAEAVFTFIDSIICPDDTITFTNISLNAVSYEWYIDSIFVTQSAELTHVFTDTGTIHCMLIADRGFCKDTTSQNIYVNEADTITWTGTTDSIFNKASNWDLGRRPCPAHVVVIPSVITQPILTTGNVAIRELIIRTTDGATLEITGGGSLILSK